VCLTINLVNLKKIFISSDHAGFLLKEDIKLHLSKKKIKYIDLGPVNDDSVDYPDYAHKVAKKVKTNKNHAGILVCGSGIGMNIVANRHKNIRAAQCFNLKSTKLSRLHNDANIITLGSRLLSKKNALSCVSVFLNTKFESGRHAKRIKKI
jgi:ribose 5-phosphate isomerase B|tara:strand:+ start:210 stop:662 length:453 start_codon:yes stop_codon:yes gene_type:complete